SLQLEGRTVVVRPWLYRITGINGDEVPLYMLDTDLPENAPEDAALTGQLYGGDQRYRLRQEAVPGPGGIAALRALGCRASGAHPRYRLRQEAGLGLGGIAMLRALGYRDIETYHMNEGHSALLTMALLFEEEPGPASRWTDPALSESVRRRCVFTTHTPVPAG